MFEPRRDGVYVEDVGSTNGTFVNGIRVAMILSPQQASSLLPQPSARELGRLVVVKSPILGSGKIVKLDSHALRVGRGGDNERMFEIPPLLPRAHAHVSRSP